MPWAKLCDNILWHPRTLGLSPNAVALFVGGLSYAARVLTDGMLPESITELVKASWPIQNVGKAVEELESRGLWIRNCDGWEIHDYLQYNMSRDEGEMYRELNANASGRTKELSRKRQRSYRERKKERNAAVTQRNVTRDVT